MASNLLVVLKGWRRMVSGRNDRERCLDSIATSAVQVISKAGRVRKTQRGTARNA